MILNYLKNWKMKFGNLEQNILVIKLEYWLFGIKQINRKH